jgi:ribokinase
VRPEVVVVGSINMDCRASVPQLPRPGETVMAADHRYTPGGKGANQAVAASRLGATTTLVGCVGSDPFGAELSDRVAREGVDTSRVEVVADAATGVAMIVVGPAGENTITVCPGANHRFPPEALAGLPELLGSADVLMLQLEIDMSTALAAARAAVAAGARIVLNVAPLPATVGDDLLELVGMADVLVANELEAAGLALRARGNGHPAAMLRGLGPDAVVVTLGEQGAVTADVSGVRSVPAFPAAVVDTVAAGDAFCAELAVSLEDGADLETAATRACAAGSLATTRPGAQTSLPTRAEVDDLLAEGRIHAS